MIRLAVIADPHFHDCAWIPKNSALPGAIRSYGDTIDSTRVFNESGPAFRAALDMAEMQDIFNAERATAGRASATLAVGIASGEVKLGAARLLEPARWVCVGPPVQVALTLAWQAGEAGMQLGGWLSK